MTDPRAYVDHEADARILSSKHPLGYAFLSRKELSLFHGLIEDRRSLPVYRAGGWVCLECRFESTDLATTATHIVQAHGAAPGNEENLDEDDSDLTVG
jgi:hypothetical protein